MLLIESSNGKLSNLTSISTGGGNHKLNSVAASAYEKMVKAAKEDGVEWGITDSYRTFEVQDKIFDWDHYKSTGKKKKKGTSGTPVAYPGKSNHGWGSAVDLKVKYDDKAHKWLTANASKFGFSNPFKKPTTEPWHWEHLSSAKSLKSGATPVEEIPVGTDKKPDTTSSDAKNNTSSGTTTTDGSTTNATTTNSNVSGNTNNSPTSLLGGGELMGWLDMFFPGKKSVSENKTKHKINEDINRIKDLMRKNL
jgi:hypothetical protein